ncbi:MAG: hypothetical protein RIQ38_984 [Pseudomonadota bacterium]
MTAAFRPILLTLLAAAAAAWVALRVGAPIPWLLGPLLLTAAASIRGLPVRSSLPLRNLGQWTIGAALGLYFTAEVGQMLLGLWWAVLLGVVWALWLGGRFGLWLEQRHAQDLAPLNPRARLATAWLASAIGGASEMTLLSERERARTDLVAAAHSLRLLIVVMTIPLGVQIVQSVWGLQVDPSLRQAAPRPMDWGAFAILLGGTLAGVGLMRAARGANPWFMGALLASIAMTWTGVPNMQMPGWMSNLAQLLVGVSLGVRFTPAFLRTAPRWMASVAIGTVAMLLASIAFAGLLAWGTGLHMATMLLGTTPGGITEMSVTAKVLGLGAPVVTAMQVSRLVAVLVLSRPLMDVVMRRRERRAAR